MDAEGLYDFGDDDDEQPPAHPGVKQGQVEPQAAAAPCPARHREPGHAFRKAETDLPVLLRSEGCSRVGRVDVPALRTARQITEILRATSTNLMIFGSAPQLRELS